MDSIVVVPCGLTRQCYLGGLTRRWRQIFNDLHKVKGEDTSTGADLTANPVLSNMCLQLDHIPLGEGQLITVLPLEIEPRNASWTT